MNIILEVVLGVVIVAAILLPLFEYRIRQPDTLVLYESRGRISLRKGLVLAKKSYR